MDIAPEDLTPRMRDACKREGLDKEDLFVKPREMILRMIKEKDVTGSWCADFRGHAQGGYHSDGVRPP